MDRKQLEEILTNYRNGSASLSEACEQLRDLPYKDLDFAKLDNHRPLRMGFPEVVFCQGKRPEHLRGIIQDLVESEGRLLATRADSTHFEAVRDLSPDLRFDPVSRTIVMDHGKQAPQGQRSISVVTAGTSDIPVAEEAAVTAEFFGNRVERTFDVGVAGIHRLFARLATIREAAVVIVVAGMEGALPSVVGGLVSVPVIAVPTSVGYGASFNGLAALLGMLCSCAPGVSVVNIDNGFGAGYIASMINSIRSTALTAESASPEGPSVRP